jgi:hypothetical protein
MASFRETVVETAMAALPVAVVYFAGWAYLSSYLAEFGIDSTQVDIPLTTVLVYSFRALYSWWIGGMAVLFIILHKAIKHIDRPYSLRRWVEDNEALIYLVLLVVATVVVYHVSKDAAADRAVSVWHGERPKTFATVSSTVRDQTVTDEYKQCWDEKRLEQIIGFKDQMYLLCRHPALPCSRGLVFLVTSAGDIILRQSIYREAGAQEAGCEPLEVG